MISTMDWYGWLILALAVLALLVLPVIALQQRRRSGGILSVGSRTRRRRR
jgi:heme exporter protein D